METRFRNTRRLLSAAAISIPLLLWLAFVVFAAGSQEWAKLILLAAIAHYLFLPWRRPRNLSCDGSASSRGWNPLRWIFEFLPATLVVIWLLTETELFAWLGSLSETGKLWDWRLLVAGAVSAINYSAGNLRSMRRLTDREIFDFIDRGEFPLEGESANHD